jgi:hypothetical protein
MPSPYHQTVSSLSLDLLYYFRDTQVSVPRSFVHAGVQGSVKYMSEHYM